MTQAATWQRYNGTLFIHTHIAQVGRREATLTRPEGVEDLLAVGQAVLRSAMTPLAVVAPALVAGIFALLGARQGAVFVRPLKGQRRADASEFWMRAGSQTRELHGDEIVPYQSVQELQPNEGEAARCPLHRVRGTSRGLGKRR